MAKFKVTVEVEVEALDEEDAFYCVEGAVEDLVVGDIVNASVKSIDELTN